MDNEGKILKKIMISDAMKNVTKICSGNIMGQIISVISLPIITRIYGAEIMGIWATIYALASIVITYCDLGLTQTLMICDEDEVPEIYSFIQTISIIICLISSIVFFVFYLLNDNFIYAITVALFVFLYSFTLRQVQCCYTWLNRNKEYDILMKNPLVNYGSVAIVSILLGVLGFIKYGYFIGITVGQIATLIHMKKFISEGIYSFKLKSGRKIIKKYINFIKFQMPSGITVSLRQQLPNLLIGNLYGNTILGYFSISQKILSVPVTFIGQALGKVFYQKCAEIKKSGKDIGHFLYKNISRAMLFGSIPMLLFAAFGDAATVFFFGSEYSVGGVICRIIVFRSFFTFLSSATQGCDIVIEKQQYTLINSSLQTLFASFGVIISYYLYNNIYICAIFMTISFIICEITYYAKLFSALRYPFQKYIIHVIIFLCLIFAFSCLLRWLFINLTLLTKWDILEWCKTFLVFP